MQRLGLKLDRKILNTQILDGVADMIRIVNTQGQVVYFNDSMEDFFSGDTDRLWCSIDQAAGPDSFCDMDMAKRSIATGEVIQREEAIGKSYYSVKTNPIRDEAGDIVGAIEIFRNKSLEKRLQIELIEKNKSMTQEMNSAKNIQQALLPKKGEMNHLRVDYFFTPAEILSGDIFDIYEIDDNTTAIYIADTVGHGFSSSMTTMFISQTMRNMPRYIQKNPAKTLEELSKRFRDLELGIEVYFTIFYAVYNRRARRFTYTNGGHNCPVLLKKDKEGIEPLLSAGYPISSLFEEVEYINTRLTVETGTEFLFYTDGVIECRNKEGEEYGLTRLKDLYAITDRNFLSQLEKDLGHFTQGSFIDDVTCAKVYVK